MFFYLGLALAVLFFILAISMISWSHYKTGAWFGVAATGIIVSLCWGRISIDEIISLVITWVALNYMFLLKIVLGYIVIGMVYAVLRFIGRHRWINDRLTHFCSKENVERSAIPAAVMKEFCRWEGITSFPPKISDFNADLFKWTILWPLTIVQYLVSHVWDFIVDATKMVLKPVVAYINAKFYGDVVVLAPEPPKAGGASVGGYAYKRDL
jgi:hypothetical protein